MARRGMPDLIVAVCGEMDGRERDAVAHGRRTRPEWRRWVRARRSWPERRSGGPRSTESCTGERFEAADSAGRSWTPGKGLSWPMAWRR